MDDGRRAGSPILEQSGGGMTTHEPASSLTRSFTDLVSAWPADDPALMAQCALLLLDGLAVALAGAAEPGPGLMAAQARMDAPDGLSTVIGRRFCTSVVNAARVNGWRCMCWILNRCGIRRTTPSRRCSQPCSRLRNGASSRVKARKRAQCCEGLRWGLRRKGACALRSAIGPSREVVCGLRAIVSSLCR